MYKIIFYFYFFLFVSISNFSWGKEIYAANLDKPLGINPISGFNNFKLPPYRALQRRAFQGLTLRQGDTAAPKSKIQARMWELGIGFSYMQHQQKSLGVPSGGTYDASLFSLFTEISLLQAFFIQAHLGVVSVCAETEVTIPGNSYPSYSKTYKGCSQGVALSFQPGARLPIPFGRFSYFAPMLAYRLDIYIRL